MSSSETHPRRPASAHAFDPLLCASLHNQIIDILRPFAEEHHFRVVRNFFVAYDEAVALQDQMSSPIITFFENIDIILNDDGARLMHFTPHLRMPYPLLGNAVLPGTSGFWDDEIWFDNDNHNWVALYQATEPEHALYFNMDLRLCTWQMELVSWMRNWYPLERALRLWLSFYQAGKFQPGNEGDIYSSARHRRYIESDLVRDLQAYHDLLSAIQARCPASTISDEPGLVDEFPVPGFQQDFLLQARRPSFTYIAPGIRVPSSEWTRQMLSQARAEGRFQEPLDPESNYESEPLPLFPGPKITSYAQEFENEHKSSVVNEISGLYCWADYLSADAVRFILPYPIGENGWVRDGNDDQSTDEIRAEGVPSWRVQNDALYQHGSCPFFPTHLPTLSVVLNNWRKLIEEGKWQVGPDGVESGIETFKDADTEELCLSYRIGVCVDDA